MDLHGTRAFKKDDEKYIRGLRCILEKRLGFY